MDIAIEQLADSLRRAGLASDLDFESACSELSAAGEAVTASRLLDRLAYRGRLTEYQRQRVAEGRIEEFVLGNYTLVSCIGAGGMGEVFKAVHRRMKRQVAIKVLSKERVNSRGRIELFQREIEHRIEKLTGEKPRGDAFEVFPEAYLATQRVRMAKHVWPDKVIPPSLRKRLRLSARDVGADGVIETVAGNCRAYQVKFRSGRAPLTWSETATFFGVTDHCDERLLFTNSEDVSEVAERRKDFSSIRGTDLDSLTAEDFDAIRAWPASKPVSRKKSSPRHYDLRRRDAEGEPVEVYSMNPPEIYGHVVHTLSFAAAAKQKIICNYKVVISGVTSAMLDQPKKTPHRACPGVSRASALLPDTDLDRVAQRPLNHRGKPGGVFQQARRHGTVLVNGEEVKAPQVANQLALAQAVSEHRLKKIFTFHRNVASARSFTSEGGEGIGTHRPDFAALHVNGAMSTAARDGLMTEFKEARQVRRGGSAERCGTHRTRRPATRRGGIPLYVEQAQGESLDAAVARAEFDEIWAVLQAMQEQDEVLDDIIHEMQAERRLTKGFVSDSRLRERVEVLGPTLTLDKLRRAIATRCLDRLARPWDEMLQWLVAYKKQHRQPRVPKAAPAPWTELGLWADHVRDLKRNGHLSAARQAQLDKLRFCWRVDGVTLDSTDGLLSERQFAQSSGLTRIADYRKRGIIKPIGSAIGPSGINYFYDPNQISELKKQLGITLDSTEGHV